MEISDDVEIYYVNSYKTSAGSPRIAVAEGDGLVEAAEINDKGELAKNIVYMIDTDGLIDEIIIEVDGDALLRLAD